MSFETGAVAGEIAHRLAREIVAHPLDAARARRGAFPQGDEVSVRQDCFAGGCEALPWEQRKPYDEFDDGYVLTVHKSQGSQWDDVVLLDESFAFQDSRARGCIRGSRERRRG